MLRYLEKKSDAGHSGPAWIARVKVSRSGRTVYFDGRALRRGSGVSSNHYDTRTGEAWWVSGVKQDGTDRHWSGRGKVLVEADAVPAYLALAGEARLDPRRFTVTHDVRPTDPADFVDEENAPLAR